MTPEAIAKIFEGAVKCDDTSEISTYRQIEEREDCFLCLTDRASFKCLLEDGIGGYVTLTETFLAMFDAGVGIHTFANASRRRAPRAVLTGFLADENHARFRSNTADVYTAFNAWLSFFGAEQISETWSTCPFCGHTVSGGACTSPECGRSTADFEAAFAEMRDILEREKSGISTVRPKYWSEIKKDSELELCYKRDIVLARDARIRRGRAERAEKKKAAEAARLSEYSEKMLALSRVIRTAEASLKGGAGADTFRAYVEEADRFSSELSARPELCDAITPRGERSPLDWYNAQVRPALEDCIAELEEAENAYTARRHAKTEVNVGFDARYCKIFDEYRAELFKIAMTDSEGGRLEEARQALIALCLSRSGGSDFSALDSEYGQRCDAARSEALRRLEHRHD